MKFNKTAIMKFTNEMKVGITVLLAVIVAIIGFRFMQDVPIFSRSMHLHTTFDKADGISRGSLVYIKGVRVGSVGQVELTPGNEVRLTLYIDTDVPIPEDSKALLTSLSIVEGKAIVIEMGNSNQFVEYGDSIQGEYTESVMEVIGQKGQELGDDVSDSISELNEFLRNLNETIDDDTRMSLDQTIKNLESATREVATLVEQKQGDIQSAIESSNSLLGQLDTLVTDSRPRVDSLMISIEQNMNELSRVSRELEQTSATLNSVLEKIDRGEGTLGKMLNDPSMYENLNSASARLDTLLMGINEDPGRYLKHMKIFEVF